MTIKIQEKNNKIDHVKSYKIKKEHDSMGEKMTRQNEEVVIQTKNLCKTYSGITVLHNVNFSLKRGEVHALVGENGAGKSTIIKILSGVEKPDEGSEIVLMGKSFTHLEPSQTIAMGLAVIYQDISLFPNLSVMENMAMGMMSGTFVDRKGMMEKARKVFDEFNIKIDVKKRFGDLSIGKQQLVSIVRAVTQNAKIIIMDEPTASLSAGEVDLLMKMISELKRKKISVIYISHKLEEIFTVADSITVLRDGNVVSSGAVGDYTQETLINQMVGRTLRFIPMQSKQEFGEVVFSVKDIKADKVNGVSFEVRRSEILGITGLVGAGRSELAQAIFGLNKLEDGSIILHGKKLSIKSPRDAIRNGISYLPEDRHAQGLFKGQTLTWNITAATLKDMLTRAKMISEKKELAVARDEIERLDIRPKNPEIPVESMSGGNQQKGLLARWLRTKPQVLIVDEPTAGVDVGAKLEIHKILRSLSDQGVSVILISSDMMEIMALSDTVVVMKEGRLVRSIEVGSATQESILADSIL